MDEQESFQKKEKQQQRSKKICITEMAKKLSDWRQMVQNLQQEMKSTMK